jgi:hypothetical protein
VLLLGAYAVTTLRDGAGLKPFSGTAAPPGGSGIPIGDERVGTRSSVAGPSSFGSSSSTPGPVRGATTIPSADSYVRPGTVGYRGSTSALTVYVSGGAASAGCRWLAYGLRCDGDLSLDHAWIKGSLYWMGTGRLTIDHSIVDGRQAWYVVYVANLAGGLTTKMTNRDSTLRWDTTAAGPFPAGYDVAPIWRRDDIRMDGH